MSARFASSRTRIAIGLVGAMAASALAGVLSLTVAAPADAATAATSASRVLFSEGSGTTSADISGNNRPATLSSTAGWGTGPTGGSALSLNGTIGSEADIPAGTINTSASFTVGAFLATTDVNRLQTAVSVDGNNVSGVYLQTVNGHVRAAMFASDSSSSALTTVDSTYTLTANTFVQATISYDAVAKTLSLYVDGSPQGSASVPSAFQATGLTVVGRGLYNGAKVDPFSGRIADVRLAQGTSSAQRAAEFAAVTQLRYTDGTGTVGTDSSGYGHNATLTGNALWMVGKQYPSALALDGQIGDAATSTNIVNTANSYSVSAWVYANDPARQQTAVSIDGNTQSAFYLQISNGTFCLCAFSADSTASTLYAARSSSTVTAATWYQLTGVIDDVAHTMSLYVNGTLAQTVTIPASWRASGALVTGHGKFGGNPVDPWNGGIEDVRMYPLALPAATAPILATPLYNSCDDPSLSSQVGTNKPNPPDPYGYGYANETQLGYTGNTYAPFAYLSGAFFARGVPATYTGVSPAICGSMYSFGVYTYGLNGSAPAGGSVSWTMAGGYLPAFTTSFTRNGIAVSITNFADKSTINGTPVELVHSRVVIRNTTTSAQVVDPAPSSGLLAQSSGGTSVPAGGSTTSDYVVGVDTFGTGLPIPGAASILAQAPSYNTAFTSMSNYWNAQLATLPTITLPNTTLPNTGLANPGTALINAYKSAFIYTRMIEVGAAPYSGQDNYYAVLEHDAPVINDNAFTQGDFTLAQQKLLEARQASGQNYDPQGANQYLDGMWKTPQAWATYLAKTGDTSFVSKYFHDDASAPSDFGPSLYTQMHYLVSLLNSSGYLPPSYDNDSTGTWLFDDYAGMIGLASYRYIATQIGQTSEATWAGQQLTSLMNATNTALAKNQQANNFSYLSCEVPNPNSANRCNTPTDANWASALWFGQNAWDLFLAGGAPSGLIGSATQVDNTYDYGYARLATAGIPYPSMGAFDGYTTAYNTAYAMAGLYGNKYRTLPITSYAWQIQNAEGGPNAWWEADGSAPSASNPWVGAHPIPEFGASPYAFPLAGQTLGLTQSIAAEGLSQSGSTYTRPLYIGRGVPDQWIAAGQTVSMANLTSTYTASSRTTYGVSISTATVGGKRQVTVTLTGTPPAGTRYIQLPSFKSAGVSSVTGGTYSASTSTVTMTGTTAVVTLNS